MPSPVPPAPIGGAALDVDGSIPADLAFSQRGRSVAVRPEPVRHMTDR